MKKSLTLVAIVALLVVVSVVAFAACMPSDPAKAKDKYADAGYTVVYDDSSVGNAAVKLALSALVTVEGKVEAKLVASNASYAGTVIWFEKSSDAKTYANYLKDHKDKDSTTYIKQDGKAVFAGDKEAYNFKKAA